MNQNVAKIQTIKREKLNNDRTTQKGAILGIFQLLDYLSTK